MPLKWGISICTVTVQYSIAHFVIEIPTYRYVAIEVAHFNIQHITSIKYIKQESFQ